MCRGLRLPDVRPVFGPGDTLPAVPRGTPSLTPHWSGQATRQAFFSMRVSVGCGPPLTGSVSAPSKAWRFWQGASPGGGRSNHPRIPRVAAGEEAGQPHDTGEADPGHPADRGEDRPSPRVRPPRQRAASGRRWWSRTKSPDKGTATGEVPAGPPGSTTRVGGGKRRVRHGGDPPRSGRKGQGGHPDRTQGRRRRGGGQISPQDSATRGRRTRGRG
jgi:hypothetical protein